MYATPYFTVFFEAASFQLANHLDEPLEQPLKDRICMIVILLN